LSTQILIIQKAQRKNQRYDVEKSSRSTGGYFTYFTEWYYNCLPTSQNTEE